MDFVIFCVKSRFNNAWTSLIIEILTSFSLITFLLNCSLYRRPLITWWCRAETTKSTSVSTEATSVISHYVLVFKFHIFYLILIVIVTGTHFFLIIFYYIQIARNGVLSCYNGHLLWFLMKPRWPYIKRNCMSRMKL